MPETAAVRFPYPVAYGITLGERLRFHPGLTKGALHYRSGRRNPVTSRHRGVNFPDRGEGVQQGVGSIEKNRIVVVHILCPQHLWSVGHERASTIAKIDAGELCPGDFSSEILDLPRRNVYDFLECDHHSVPLESNWMSQSYISQKESSALQQLAQAVAFIHTARGPALALERVLQFLGETLGAQGGAIVLIDETPRRLRGCSWGAFQPQIIQVGQELVDGMEAQGSATARHTRLGGSAEAVGLKESCSPRRCMACNRYLASSCSFVRRSHQRGWR